MKKLLLFLLFLAGVANAQLKNSYGYTKWGLKNTTIYADTNGRLGWKSMGTVDTGKAFPFSQGNSDFILAWKHTSNGDDSGQFALRFLCYDARIGRWMDTAQYQPSAAFTITKSVTSLRDTLPGLYQGRMVLCDSVKPVITSAAGTNKGDTTFITSLTLRTVYGPGRGEIR